MLLGDTSAAIYGISGLTLTADEREFFADVKPYGFILFSRNCESPTQVKALTDAMRDLTGRAQLPILIDQEGGRVARLRQPAWWTPPAAATLAALSQHQGGKVAKEAIYLSARLIAAQLRDCGITVNCAPLADIPVEGSHDIIGDRAYGADAEQVSAFARIMANGLHDGGVMSILKHIPGHGRARVDSHEALPVVEATLAQLQASDFIPFERLSDLPMGMTAHIIYNALDTQNVATTSPIVIDYIRRQIGFDGLLMSDDLSMKALQGDFSQRAQATLSAGCDVILHCNGEMDEMIQVAKGTARMSVDAIRRDIAAWRQVDVNSDAEAFDVSAAQAKIAALI